MTIHPWRRLTLTLTSAVLLLAVGIGPGSARAQSSRAVGPTPPRVAYLDGEVSFWRPGAEDWAPAQVNTALAAGDTIYVGNGGNAEIEIGSRAYVRAGTGTQVAVASLETGYLQLEVTSGHCTLDLPRLPEGQEIEVDSPQGAFTIDRAGYYRVDVDDDTTFTVRNGGVATVVPAGGESSEIGSDQQAVLQGTDQATVSVNRAGASDDWDRWNADRGGRRSQRSRSAEYVPPAVAGVDDLDDAGDWEDTPSYGHVWIPRDVPPDWAPYSTGRWVYDPYYDWTWVDYEPWGWAPYHYGRWCRWHDRWGWAPGPVVVEPVYAPALVAFFGGGGVSVSVGVGAPVVSWVALGWGEPVLPWWGPVGFHARPYWGGWGGPRVVNNTVINNTTIVNVRNINHFTNVDTPNAVVGVSRDHFGRGSDHIRIASDQARRLQPVRGSVGVRPVAESLVPKAGRATRPPEAVQTRRVVATRRPQDPAPRLRAAGIEPRTPVQKNEPRIVTPTRGPRGQGPGERQRMGEQRGPGGQPAENVRPERGGPGVVRPERGAPGGQPAENARPEHGGRPERGGRMSPPPPPGREGGMQPTAPEHGRRGERGPATETAPNMRDQGRDRGRNREQVQPGGEPSRQVAPPPPAEHGAPDRSGERRGRDMRRGRPEPPSERQHREVAPPRENRGERVMPPPRENRGERVMPPPRENRSERVMPPPQENRGERAMPPPRENRHERAMPPPRENRGERVMPPPQENRGERAMPPPRENRHERAMPPPRENRNERATPPTRENRNERMAPPMRSAERSAPPPRAERPPVEQRQRSPERPPPPQTQRQAPSGKDHGRRRDPNQ